MLKTNNLPLSGIRVIDFTQVMLGPAATQMLADFGADVIKIEKPKIGDLSRVTFGAETEEKLNNSVFCSLNRNKRSVVLDLREDSAKQAVLELVRTGHVVVDNFRPGVMERLGFGFEDLKKVNPKIISASGSGFGRTGPFTHKAGIDALAQALSGVIYRRSDLTANMTVYPTALCDYTAGMHLAQGILAAIIAVERTGQGQRVEVSLYDSMIAMQTQEAVTQLLNNEELNWGQMPLTGVFNTTDGAVVIVGAFKENPLMEICAALDIEDLSVEYPDFESQIENRDYLQKRLRERFVANSTEYWLQRFDERDLLCGPVRSLKEALSCQQTIENEMISTTEHPLHGELPLISPPIHFSEFKYTNRHPPPLLGEHTEEILLEINKN